jgi:DNA-binding transcriptional LysR family regulator
MHRVVPRALVTFLRAHPDVDVTAVESPTPRTLRVLADRKADLGVVVVGEAYDAGLPTEPLGDDSLVVIGQTGGVLADRTALTYREVAEHPLVGLADETALHRWIERNLGGRAPVAHYRTRVGDLGTVVALAAAGVGLAVVPRRALDPGAELEVCELLDPWARRQHLLCRGAGGRGSSPSVDELARHLRLAANPD